MSAVHEAPHTGSTTGRFVDTYAGIEGEMESYRPWQPPKLSAAGKPFKPRRHAPGDVVVFEVDGVRRMGPVWSEGPDSGTLWVVLDQVAFLVRGVR